MKILNLIRIAIRAMSRNKMRTFLTMLGIIIGVASVISMLAIGQGSKESIQKQISQMGANMITVSPSSGQQGGVRMDATSMQLLTVDDANAIRNGAGSVAYVSPFVSGSGQAVVGANNWPTSMQGVSPSFLHIRKMVVSEGVPFTDQDVRTAAKVCLIGKTVVANLFPEGTLPVGKILRFNKIPFLIIGVLEEKGTNTFGQDQDNIILAPYTTMQKRILAISHLQSIYVSAQSEMESEQAVVEIGSILRNNPRLTSNEGDKFDVRSQQELITMFSSTSEMLTVLLAAIAGISLLVGGIGIMNIMFVSVTERTREIGLRMAVGGKGSHILTQFLMEAIIVSIGGGLIGALIGVGATSLIGKLAGWPISISETSVIVSFVVCTVIGVFFGWYPARKASALDPIEALRYE
ncbi:MAG TPA: ABC transporter permease [Marinilabiliaceae bacterium]|nr:ABC transporter permease [Marinilabiliaceae bacterium]